MSASARVEESRCPRMLTLRASPCISPISSTEQALYVMVSSDMMAKRFRSLRGADLMGDPVNPSDGSSSGASPGRRLDSWKEIAAYLKRNERTARRWEQTEALPVFRHTHAKRDSVYAYTTELDGWWRTRRFRLDETHPPQPILE